MLEPTGGSGVAGRSESGRAFAARGVCTRARSHNRHCLECLRLLTALAVAEARCASSRTVYQHHSVPGIHFNRGVAAFEPHPDFDRFRMD